MWNGKVWGLFIAIPRVNDLPDTDRDWKLGAIAEPHQDLATEFGVFLNEQLNNLLSCDFGEIYSRFWHRDRFLTWSNHSVPY
jgi:hypothetical protein